MRGEGKIREPLVKEREDIYTRRVTSHLGLSRANRREGEGAACNLAIAIQSSKGGAQRAERGTAHTEKPREATQQRESKAAGGGNRQRSGSGSRSGAPGRTFFLKLDRGMMNSTGFSS